MSGGSTKFLSLRIEQKKRSINVCMSSFERPLLARETSQQSAYSQASYDDSVYEYNSGSDDDLEEDDANLPPKGGDSSANNASSSSLTGKQVLGAVGSHLYRKITSDGLVNTFFQDASSIATLCGIGEASAMNLLRQANYDRDAVVSKFFEQDEDAKNESIYIPSKVTCYPCGDGEDDEQMCFVCCDEVKNEDFISLGCNHYFCRGCWVRFLTTKIVEEGEVFNLRCMSPDCNIVISPSCLESIAQSNQEVRTKYRTFLGNKLVSENSKYTRCPSSDCECIVELMPSFQGSNISCFDCDSSFCLKCQQASHSPASCEDVKKWDKLAQDDSLTASWLTANTKDCPKCQGIIEKNGGCNHMTCRKCRHEFCWICLGPWRGHTACNNYKEKPNVSEERKRLQRYTHFWVRYKGHDASAKLVTLMMDKAMATADEVDAGSSVTKLGATASEYLGNAVETLVKCRKVLKYTYVHAYFMTDPAQQTLFEFQQAELESAVESLNELAENEQSKGTEIANLCKVAVTKAEHILEAGEDGVFAV